MKAKLASARAPRAGSRSVERRHVDVVGERPDYPAVFVSDGSLIVTLWQVESPEIAVAFDRRANVGLHHLALAVADRPGLDALHERVASWPDVVVEFAPALSGKGPKIHFMVREPSGIRLEFAYDPRLEAARSRRVVCASPDYFAQHGSPTTPGDLLYRPAITFESVSAPGVWRFQSGSIQLDAALRSRLSVNTTDAAIDAAIAGMGLARANSYQVVDHVRRGALALTLETFEPPPRPVNLVYNCHARLPLKLRAFIDFVTPRLRDRLKAAAL